LESTTTRKAAGLDFTAIGGKRQGRKVPQSLKTTQWNPAVAGFGKPNLKYRIMTEYYRLNGITSTHHKIIPLKYFTSQYNGTHARGQ
jgi:hypothetical protein